MLILLRKIHVFTHNSISSPRGTAKALVAIGPALNYCESTVLSGKFMFIRVNQCRVVRPTYPEYCAHWISISNAVYSKVLAPLYTGYSKT